jgi:tRNA (mo5U34)-methyltransferase
MENLTQLIKHFASSKYPQLVRWSESLAETYRQKTTGSEHAQLWHKWMKRLEEFPNPQCGTLDASGDRIVIANQNGDLSVETVDEIRDRLIEHCPWRIGPWHFFGVDLKTEWDSSKKWNRFSESVYFDDARVLDVGCNNGYFGWKAIDAGAASVVGCDPFLLYNFQHEIFRRYSAQKHRHHILPITDMEVPEALGAFDVAMSLGVLIHRRSPIDHLIRLHGSLRKRGQLVLETMATESQQADVIVPAGRYMKMRGIWFVPSIGMLKRWLDRTGFVDVEIVDVSVTDSTEQGKTDFMPFESLSDFLDSAAPGKTVEGHTAPVRVAIVAVKGT